MGDGWRFRGRGYIQLTGRSNYTTAGEELGMSLAADPDRAAEPETASRIAIWYWQTRVPVSALQDCKAATLAINGGFNGLDDRQARFASWVARLTPAVIDDIAAGRDLR